MNHFKHPACNTVLPAAPEDAGKVEDLHICRLIRDFGDGEQVHCVESFWKPDAEELLALMNGGCVVLSVVAHTFPPVRVFATPKVD